MDSPRKVFVTGCFDLLHSGHVAFLQEAATYGEVYVGLGSDSTVAALKGRYPVNNQAERKFMLEALTCVREVVINRGSGIMDFLDEFARIRPDMFIVNEDGNTPAKEELCRNMGVEYRILARIPHAGLPARSTTAMRNECTMPFRIDLAGGWLDQPYVGVHAAGPVLTISIEPTVEFNDRSGMASSTRKKAIELWHFDVPPGNREQLAKVLFSYENPPGTRVIAGSQDALGIVLPGLNRLEYDGGYWPRRIDSVHDEETLRWLEDHLFLLTLEPRVQEFDVLKSARITLEGAKALATAAEGCWDAIVKRDIALFGKQFRESFEAQISLFPGMVNGHILSSIDRYRRDAHGWKLSGAGGGGYIIYVSDTPMSGAMRIKIRRRGLE